MSDIGNQPPAVQPEAAQPLTVPLGEVAVAPTVFMIQPPYPLTESESILLDRGQSRAFTWAANIFLTGVGAVISSIAPAALQFFQGKPIALDLPQLAIAGATVLLSGLVWFSCFWFPGDYEKTMRKIKKHFQDNPPKQQIGGRQ
ncbi:hypothetical protein [Burkholderia multivorans]|uniref:hypothetical protein n=1 Tax=Burkholderia multivorans TaxID=87883 RepID=UPI0011B21F46|nr:hypothetical protein [Burkholderia multivorans]MBU9219604.1 hypothetical protein [Burkholderia multivorans]MBU9418519.1 hypothetical protein [Burkholderia multivorans]